jgi:hypothetical protein
MSLATAKPQPLTTIAGGINRLRTKGAASRDALFDLLNGYVTMSNTVVPRPGTNRNADLTMGGTVPAGTTKGLVAFEDGFWVFSNTPVGDVPDNYNCVVLVHPAVNSVTTQTGSADSEILSGEGIVGKGEYWGETDGVGLSNFQADTITPFGNATPAILTGAPVLFLGDVTYSGTHYLMLVMQPGTPQNFFTTLELTLSGGSTNTYDSGAATYTANGQPNGEPLSGLINYCTWLWPTSNVDFDASISTAVEFDGLNYTGNAPIPLKEIHFAAPFLGFLYVVAEFEPDSSGLGSVFHYWVQVNEDTPTWAAGVDHQIGDIVIPSTGWNGLFYIASRATQPNPVWTPTTLETVGNIVEPSVPNGFEFTCISTEGNNPVTGSSEPTWPTADGATVSEFTSLDTNQSIAPPTAAIPATNVPNPTTVTKYSNLAGGL